MEQKFFRTVPVSERLPEIGGRYVALLEEQNDLGKSTFYWNVCFNENTKTWTDNFIEYPVVHWLEEFTLPDENHFIRESRQHYFKQGNDAFMIATKEIINHIKGGSNV